MCCANQLPLKYKCQMILIATNAVYYEKQHHKKEQWFENEFSSINELFVILCIDSFFNIRFDYDFTGLALWYVWDDKLLTKQYIVPHSQMPYRRLEGIADLAHKSM